MKNQALYDQAKSYLSLGFSIIPLNNKKQALVRWKNFQLNYPTTRNLMRWFNRSDVSGIGIVTGHVSNLVVIDVDPRNGGTNGDLEQYMTVSSKTPSGGWHYYFKPQIESDFKTRHFAKGYDVQGEGAYVVAPPSLHESGTRYEWLKSPFENQLQPYPSAFVATFEEEYLGKLDSKPFKPAPLIPTVKGLIAPNAVVQIRNLRMEDIIRNEGFDVPQSSKNYVHILCPFHNDHNPSYSINLEKNFGRCFRCQEPHNAIDFVTKLYGISFREACIYLMEKYGIRND